MRYSAEHKAQTREKLLEAAHRALHAGGAEGLGVAGVTADAGLTHGAFYAHFESKEALVAETVSRASVRMRERFVQRTAGLSPADAFRAQMDHYLSPAHLEVMAGYLLPALSNDAVRVGGAVRDSYEQNAETLVELMQSLVDGLGLNDPHLARSMTAEMVGALSLARAAHDEAHTQRILEASHDALLRRVGLA